jgi:hypothetical protein
LGTASDDEQAFILPRSVDTIIQTYRFEADSESISKWEGLWGFGADDTKEKLMDRQSFVISEMHPAMEDLRDEDDALAQAALKV